MLLGVRSFAFENVEARAGSGSSFPPEELPVDPRAARALRLLSATIFAGLSATMLWQFSDEARRRAMKGLERGVVTRLFDGLQV